jgi:hypothetical protein
VDNPNPLRRSNRMWTNVILEADRYDGEHILYPMGYVVGHTAPSVRPFYAPGGEPAWRNVSHFGLYPEHRFAGIHRPDANTNCLIVRSPEAPGMKLWTPGREGGRMELWFGSGVVFEDPGTFVQPYEPIQYTLWFYNTGDIGRVRWADENLAIGYRDGAFRVTFARPVEATVTVRGRSGVPRVELAGAMKPGKVFSLVGEPDDAVYVSTRGRKPQRVLPLRFADTTARFPDVHDLGGKFRLELEEICNHFGAPTSRDAVGAARKLLEGKIGDKQRALSIANTCYRWGHFELAEKIARQVKGMDAADHLLALIAWERGEEVDFGSAGQDSFHHRALLAVQVGRTDEAIAWLDKLILARPSVYRPRLLRAYLKRDAGAAKWLVAANPASPEAQLVCEMLGVDGAAEARERLVDGNPGAERAVENFRQELTEGRWRHVRRYEPMLPKETTD